MAGTACWRPLAGCWQIKPNSGFCWAPECTLVERRIYFLKIILSLSSRKDSEEEASNQGVTTSRLSGFACLIFWFLKLGCLCGESIFLRNASPEGAKPRSKKAKKAWPRSSTKLRRNGPITTNKPMLAGAVCWRPLLERRTSFPKSLLALLIRENSEEEASNQGVTTSRLSGFACLIF